MRGKVLGLVVNPDGERITPAHAGKSMTLPSIANIRGDYPRACGEKHSATVWLGCAVGLPPRMRGKVNHLLSRGHANGITPAHAGKSCSAVKKCRIKKDYPRACGEKTGATINQLRQAGLPPRMRGKAEKVSETGKAVGITPAHAGKRLAEPGVPAQGQDYPRACGEKRECQYLYP